MMRAEWSVSAGGSGGELDEDLDGLATGRADVLALEIGALDSRRLLRCAKTHDGDKHRGEHQESEHS